MTDQFVDPRLRARAVRRAAWTTRSGVPSAPRSVRRAQARMARPSGRKGAKAAVRVAAWDLAGAREALRLISATVRAQHSRAGQMPHTPRKTPRVKLRPHLGDRR